MSSSERFLRAYLSKVENGDLLSVMSLIAQQESAGNEDKLLGFTGTLAISETIATAGQILAQFNQQLEANKYESMELMREDVEKQLIALGVEFLKSAGNGPFSKFEKFLAVGFPVNFQHPETMATALHQAAGAGHLPTIRALLDTGRCDLLIKDKFGKWAAHDALLCNRSQEVIDLLFEQTKTAAEHAGFDFFEEIRTTDVNLVREGLN